MTGNPDIAALRAFLADGAPVAVVSSPLLEATNCRFVSYDAGAATISLEFQPPVLFRQGAGAVQGGIVGAMLDFAMAFSAHACLTTEKAAVTAASTTQFCAAAGPGLLTAKGQVTRQGRSLIFCSATLDEDGRLIATGTSTLAVVEAR